MEYALVYWIEDKSTSILKKSALITCKEVGSTGLVEWSCGNGPTKAFEAKVLAISKNRALLEEKANKVMVEPQKKTGLNRKAKKRTFEEEEVPEPEAIQEILKKGKKDNAAAKIEAQKSAAKSIMESYACMNENEQEEANDTNSLETSAADTFAVIHSNSNIDINYGENLCLEQKLEEANRQIMAHQLEIAALRAELDMHLFKDSEIRILQTENESLKEQLQAKSGNHHDDDILSTFQASPSKVVFLRNLSAHLSAKVGLTPDHCSTENHPANGLNSMVELEQGSGIYIKMIERATILLKARGDPGQMLSMALDKLIPIGEQAMLSAHGKRKSKALDKSVHLALIAFLQNNTSSERFKTFDFVRALNNKFSSARRTLKLAEEKSKSQQQEKSNTQEN